VIETVVPDNLKAAVIRAAFGVDGGTALNRSYRELARHYGFKIDPTPVYAPKKKGKVESGVKYVKGNFFRGRDGDDAVTAARELQRWNQEIAGMREHGTTGQRPMEVFGKVEQAALRTLPATRFEPVEWKEATVHRDSHVLFGRRLYSVPWRFIGKTVWLRVTPHSVAAYFDDVRIATHTRRGPDCAARSTSTCRITAPTSGTAAGATGSSAPIGSGSTPAASSARCSTRTTCSRCCAPCRPSSRTSRSSPASARKRPPGARASTARTATRA
jgi:hypothetical protein